MFVVLVLVVVVVVALPGTFEGLWSWLFVVYERDSQTMVVLRAIVYIVKADDGGYHEWLLLLLCIVRRQEIEVSLCTFLKLL